MYVLTDRVCQCEIRTEDHSSYNCDRVGCSKQTAGTGKIQGDGQEALASKVFDTCQHRCYPRNKDVFINLCSRFYSWFLQLSYILCSVQCIFSVLGEIPRSLYCSQRYHYPRR